MKKIYYFIALLAIIIVASIAYALTSRRNLPANNTGNVPSMNNSNPVNQDQPGKIKISTDQGVVSINDIEKNPVEKIAFDGSVVFGKTDNYDMSYYPPDQGFIITLENQNLQSARMEAENDFLHLLGINKEQACLLKVTLNVPYDISKEASGINYGLSFCPNGKPFPKN